MVSGVHLSPLKLTLYLHVIHEQDMGTESVQWVKWPEKGHPHFCLGGVRQQERGLPVGACVPSPSSCCLRSHPARTSSWAGHPAVSPGGFAGGRAKDLESLGHIHPQVNPLPIAKAFGMNMYSACSSLIRKCFTKVLLPVCVFSFP